MDISSIHFSKIGYLNINNDFNYYVVGSLITLFVGT